MDLTKEKLIHMTDYYNVWFIPESERKKFIDPNGVESIANFVVRSKLYETTEFGSSNLPVALAQAEYWNACLREKAYLHEEEGMQEVFDFDDDGGMLN